MGEKNEWRRGYPDIQPYDGWLNDWEIFWSVGGAIWHRRAWLTGEKVKVVGGGVEDHEPRTIVRLQTGERDGDQQGYVTLDLPVNGYTGFPREALVPA